MLLNKIFPETVMAALEAEGLEHIYEVRIRTGAPITVNRGGKYVPLGASGVVSDKSCAFLADKDFTQAVFSRAVNYSVYAVNDQLRQGYLALSEGVRMGVAGEAVAEDGRVNTIRNVTSLCIRVPHAIPGCSARAFKLMRRRPGPGVFNTLILSPPGAGKTTFLRDIASQIAAAYPDFNTLIADERGEITAPAEGLLGKTPGDNIDVVFGAPKSYAFTAGIRALRPDVILADELGGAHDAEYVRGALTAGVSVVASIHAATLTDLANKADFCELLSRKLFERYVVLSARLGPGTVEGIYDANLAGLYFSA